MAKLNRRSFLAAAAVSPLLVAQARAATADLALMCDPTLAAPLAVAAEAFRASAGIQVHIFATAPGLIVPQITRDVQNDMLVSQIATLDQADRQGLLASGNRAGPWRNSLVLAEAAGASGSPESGKFAVSELASASGIDGTAIAARLAIPPARIVSAIDTPGVAFLLTSGVARTGLLYRTDVRADPRLRELGPVPDQPPPLFAAAARTTSRRPNHAAFVTYLASPRAAALLAANGLELQA